MTDRSRASSRHGRAALVSVGAIFAALLAAYGVAFASTGTSQLARTIVWLEADVDDIDRFPARTIEASTPAALPPSVNPLTDEEADRLGAALGMEGAFAAQLASTDTSAFVVVQEGELIYEWYADGTGRETLHTSFSVAKSFLSTLVGIAIADGSMGSVDDPITDYIPELLDRDDRFGDITLRHLLTMSSGLAYEEMGLPWSDDASTYYSPDLRATGLSAIVDEAPGQTWLYNNYNPLLLGMALERATGEHIADYMSRVLWAPLGAEADASWSLDSDASGFEKMESGVNARAVDYARLGLMVANDGRVGDRQVVPQEWLRDATAVDATTDPAEHYGYFWWVFPRDGAPADIAAQGNFGQYIYIAPEDDIVVVRLGRGVGGVEWPELMGLLARELSTMGVEPIER